MKGLCQRHLESQRMSVLALGHIEVTDMGAMGACQWETRATTTEGNEGEREKQWHKDGVSLKWSHTRKKQTFIPNVSCAIPKKKKKRAKGKKMSREGKNVYIIKQLQCSCCFISVIIMIIPSSSDTSSISSTVSGKLIRCFSVVVFWAWRKENSYRQQQKGRFNFSYNMFPCDYHHPFSEHLTMETVSSVTSFRTSITEM